MSQSTNSGNATGHFAILTSFKRCLPLPADPEKQKVAYEETP
jgi:hypothetical protein